LDQRIVRRNHLEPMRTIVLAYNRSYFSLRYWETRTRILYSSFDVADRIAMVIRTNKSIAQNSRGRCKIYTRSIISSLPIIPFRRWSSVTRPGQARRSGNIASTSIELVAHLGVSLDRELFWEPHLQMMELKAL
jgi:hypothetical protein